MPKPRRALALVSATVVLGLLAGCGGGDTATNDPDGKVTITFTAYGGDGQKAMIAAYQKPYTAAHSNITFVNTSPPDIAQVKAQVLSKSVKWDVVAVAPAAASQNCGKLFEELDFSDLKNKGDLVEGTVGKCYLGNWINANPIAFRTDSFPDASKAPKTAADFFDLKKFPGKRGVLTNIQNGVLEYALLADGVKPDKLYPLDVPRALKKLDTIRSQTTFAPNVGALQQAVGAAQVDMFIMPDSRLVPLMDSGTKITVTWDVTVTALNAFAVPKGSPNKEAARRFIETIVSPEAVQSISEALGTQPINTAAKANLSDNAKKVQVAGPQNTGTTVSQDVDWYTKNFDQVNTQFTNWLVG